jgi:phenylalanyl-tRNA synthetase beta chain
VNKLLGLKLNEKEMKELLERMGHNYDSNTGLVEVGCWRMDILHEVDLIEDIAIAYGYDNFVPEIPEISTIGGENLNEMIKKKISDIFSGVGFLEISNFHLTNKINQFEKMGISEKMEKGYIKLEESKTEYNILRKNLTHYIMKIFSENVDSEYPQKIFETGRVFEVYGDEIDEKEKLSLGISPGNFTNIKESLDYLFRMFDLENEYKIIEPEVYPNYFIDGRVGEIIFNGKKIGFIGEINPKILRNWKIKMPVALVEIELNSIFDFMNRAH